MDPRTPSGVEHVVSDVSSGTHVRVGRTVTMGEGHGFVRKVTEALIGWDRGDGRKHVRTVPGLLPGGSDNGGSVGRGWTYKMDLRTPNLVGRTVSVTIVFTHGDPSESQQGGDGTGSRYDTYDGFSHSKTGVRSDGDGDDRGLVRCTFGFLTG